MNKLITKIGLGMLAVAVMAAPGFAMAQDLTPGAFTGTFNGYESVEMSTESSNQNSANFLGGNGNGSGSGSSNTTTTTTVTQPTGTPEMTVIGASRIGSGMADVTLFYDSANANYTSSQKPFVYIEYVNMATDETRVTNYFYENIGSRNTTFTLFQLSHAAKYEYRAVMKYNGHTYKTGWKTFTTPGYGTTTTVNSSNNPAPTNPVVTVPTVAKTASAIGVTKVTNSVKSAVYTAGSNHANGVAIGITDTQARVSQGDTIEFTVQYQNTRTTSLLNTELAIQLPEEYEYISSRSDFEYDESTNVITLPTGRIAPGGAVKTVTFRARAIGDGTRDVKTTATLYYEGGHISASDRDAFHGGSKSALGASVFGAGFFPQTFVGWVLILLLITILIVAARRYMKPAPPAQAPKTA